jgi:hypothetical protein
MEVGARRGAHFQQRTSIAMIMSPLRQQSRVYKPMGMPQAAFDGCSSIYVLSGISKSNACVVAVGWLQRIPSDARMMKTHDRILLVTGPGKKWL